MSDRYFNPTLVPVYPYGWQLGQKDEPDTEQWLEKLAIPGRRLSVMDLIHGQRL